MPETKEFSNMVEVTERSANWRLFGGGGLLVGGLLLLLAALLPYAGTPGTVTFWLYVVGILLVGIALFFVAFGQTGSNGAVGASVWGKLMLVIAGIAAIVTALIAVLGNFGITALAVISPFVAIVFAVALVLSAVAIFGRGVAKGIAKWILFLPAVWSVIAVINAYASFDSVGFIPIVFSVLVLLAGAAYLFNKLDVKAS
jgi:hypothetical protein